MLEAQTEETNSEAPAIQTEPGATTDTSSSPTSEEATNPPPDGEQPKDEGQRQQDGDDLDASAGDLANDGKPDAEGEGGDEDANELFGAPVGDEGYDLTGLLPDDMTLDAEGLAEFTPVAKELNLSGKGLVKVATAGLPIVQKQFHQGLIADVVAQRKGWEVESRNMVTGYTGDDGAAVGPDPVFSGDNYEAVTVAAARGIDKLTTDASGQPRIYPGANADGTPGTFRDFLKSTGLGNHPAMVQAFYLVGKLAGEDTDFIRHGDVPKAKLSREEKYYGAKP